MQTGSYGAKFVIFWDFEFLPISNRCGVENVLSLFRHFAPSVSHVSRVQTSLSCAPALTVGNQPLERNVDIVFLLATDAVTADLTVLDRVQIHLLYQTVFIKGS